MFNRFIVMLIRRLDKDFLKNVTLKVYVVKLLLGIRSVLLEIP
jgi:hypothetical protein